MKTPILIDSLLNAKDELVGNQYMLAREHGHKIAIVKPHSFRVWNRWKSKLIGCWMVLIGRGYVFYFYEDRL